MITHTSVDQVQLHQPVNEQNNMNSVKSFQCNLQFRSSNKTVSPVIDVSTIIALIMNRINNIDNVITVNPVKVYRTVKFMCHLQNQM